MTTQDFFEKYSQNLSYRVEGLANCESEQISRIGAIQPFGFFLACRGRDLEIAGASQNLAEFLGLPLEKLLGSKLVSILKLPTLESIDEDAFRRATLRGPVQAVLLRNGSEVAGYTASVHRVNDDLCVDIEPVIPGGSGEYPVAYIQDLVASLNEQDQLAEIADTVAVRFRTLTKFDRVMIYRFLDSWDGEVIGESKNEGLEPYLHLRYPAGDIPEQARKLYYDSKFRIIFDSSAEAVPVMTVKGLGREELDLSCTSLRASSPIHLKYLQNMGVKCSFSVPIKVHGRLWGLISCHHYTEVLRLPHEIRSASELTAQMLSARVVDYVAKRRLLVRNQTLSVTQKLLQTVAEGNEPVDAFKVNEDLVLTTTQSSAAYVRIMGQEAYLGARPRQATVDKTLAYVRSNDIRSSWKSENLKADLGLAETDPAAAGAFAVPLSLGFEDALIWFRPELSREIKWGGRPKALDSSKKSVLEPRASFSAWAEQVRDHSAPWTDEDAESAQSVLFSFVQGIFAKATALARAYQELQRVGEAKDEFISLVSHELRTPLGIIIGWVDIMKDQTDVSEDMSEAIRVVDRNARLQVGLINDLLDASRIISGKLRIDPQPGLNIAHLIGEVVASLEPTARAKDIRMAWTRPASTFVTGDSDRIRQIIWNLLTNALKFTPKHGTVTVALETHDSDYQISVSDSGVGIEPTSLKAVFERFVQVGNEKARHSGLGLGLSIVKALTELHGGTVRAESAGIGYGAKFIVSLPIYALGSSVEDEQALATEIKIASTTHLKGRKILIAEDQEDSARALKILIERFGGVAEIATNGVQALQMASGGRFDLILSDIGMPEMNGYEFMRAWRKLEESRRVDPTPAVALTAYARSKDRAQALEAGFQNHIAKPVDRAELLAVIRSVLKM